MRNSIKIITTLLALGFSTPAPAAGEHYVGAGTGAFSLNNGINTDTVFGAYMLIGHHFNEYFSAEVRLGATASSDSGDAITPKAKQRMDFVAHYIKPQIALSESLTAYALAGFAVVHGSYQATTGAKQSKTRISYAYGAGLSYQANDDYSIDTEITHMLGKAGNSAASINTGYKGLEANTYTAAIKYHF
ncbi:porin family protein [Mariprofundus sp. EBB-1]|uniref:porin family protein n=1 Tax=Mariprofundus sp. EBB-1 TaxID=2650971 RepID=UPI000EF28E32|nr:porin family protein [Mariprofundus sp. EBB-1]RLL53007.1 porin family protein [Mariprofundus sp. EBB-1]